ncbi:MAG: response regulator [Deltaproteobacteria bacterium]|nr:response regulator [Deltaproteobacteria bacterium]
MENEASRCQGRILVVDKDDWCREFLTQVIKLVGLEDFRLATSVEEALATLQECTYDLVITDFKLPDFNLLVENLRQRFPTTRFILMVHQRNQTQQITYVENMEIVIKPLCFDEMARKIREAIHQKQRFKLEEEMRRLKAEVFRLFS